jgi:hypothetical protein
MNRRYAIPLPSRTVIYMLMGSFAFAIAYPQLPLYSENQNTYLLHGLARGGLGLLWNDWQANTADPTPFFSLLVSVIYRYLSEYLFHLIYGLMLMAYAYSMIDIAAVVHQNRKDRSFYLTCIGLLLIIHSKPINFLFKQTIGILPTYILTDGVAEQTILGPVFQPSVFGIFLIMSVRAFLRNKFTAAGTWAALPTLVHPTYLLSSLGLALSYTIFFLKAKKVKTGVLPGICFLFIILPSAWLTYANFWPTSPEVAIAAQKILHSHINFHADPFVWFDRACLIKISLIVIAFLVARESPISLIIGICFCLGALGTVIQVASGNLTLALLFPWRISAFLVPMCSLLVAIRLVTFLFGKCKPYFYELQPTFSRINIGIIACLLIMGISFDIAYSKRAAKDDNRPMLDYVCQNRRFDQVYLIPIHLYDFRVTSGASTFVDRRTHPYKDIEVLEWQRRIRMAELIYAELDAANYQNAREKLISNGITHFIVERNHYGCADHFDKVYEDEAHIIFSTAQ